MSFRPSISFSLVILFAVLAAASHWSAFLVSEDALSATVRSGEVDRMRTIGRVIEELIAEQSRRARLAARLTASIDKLGASLHNPGVASTAAIRELLTQSMTISGLAEMQVTNSQEIVVHRAHDPQRHGDHSALWGVFEALAGASQLATSRADGVLVLHAIEPVRWHAKTVGTLAAGVRIDAELLRRLARDLGTEISLVARSGVLLAGSAETPYALDQTAIDAALLQKIPVYRHHPADARTLGYLPLTIVDDAYIVVAALDSSMPYQMLDEARGRSLAYLLLILAVSTLLGLVLVRWILRPLRQLRQRSASLALTLTGKEIETPATDEVSAVVTVLDTLTERLVQRNEELVEAKRAADQASDAKSQFLSNMSHEIRTPLNGILGMAEMLARTPLSPTQARYLQAISGSGQSLHALLGDILDLAKIEAGKVVTEEIDFDLQPLLSGLADSFRELASTNGNLMTTDFRLPARVELRGDPTRVRQILANLLGNANKFTKGGTLTLGALITEAPAPDRRIWLRFTVRDTGIGIAPEALARLFQPFVQADQTTTRRFGGSGLGLVICRHLASLLGGTITADSQVGRGSTFIVELPFGEARAPLAAARDAAPATQKIGGRVLVAEDNPVNQSVIEAMLRELGVDACVVGNGALAVAALRSTAYDLVLMDCQMPVMDGYAATAAIRAEPGPLARVPIIALTANTLPEDRQHCLTAGMNDYLSKPVRLETLATALRRWLPPGSVTGPGTAAASAAGELPPAAEAAPPASASAAPPATADAAPAPVLDRSALLDNPNFGHSTSGNLIERVIGIYLENTPRLLAAISDGLPAQTWPEVTRAAHSLKSSSVTIGLHRVAAVAARIESLAREHDAAAVADELPGLQTECAQGIPELQAELARLSTGAPPP